MMDPRDPKSDRLLLEMQGGGWRAFDWRPDGRELLVGEGLSANHTKLWLVDARTGEKRMLLPDAGEVAYRMGRYARHGRGVYVTTDRDGEFARLAYVDLATSKVTSLTSDIPWDVDDFEMSDDGKTIAFVTNEDGVSRLYLMDTARRS